jgi:hypothetical protein
MACEPYESIGSISRADILQLSKAHARRSTSLDLQKIGEITAWQALLNDRHRLDAAVLNPHA